MFEFMLEVHFFDDRRAGWPYYKAGGPGCKTFLALQSVTRTDMQKPLL